MSVFTVTLFNIQEGLQTESKGWKGLLLYSMRPFHTPPISHNTKTYRTQ